MITIKTRLDAGIYASEGGGETRTVATYATGPRNLLRAIARRDEIAAANVRSYGNIGCGKTWIEIDGKPIDQDALDAVAREPDRTPEGWSNYSGGWYEASRTEKARDLIDDVATGEYARERARIAACSQAYDDAYEDGYNDAAAGRPNRAREYGSMAAVYMDGRVDGGWARLASEEEPA